MTHIKNNISQILNQIEHEMRRITLWQGIPPEQAAFLSKQPFALDTMAAHEWLQWIFIPRMRAILDANAEIPRNFALSPYFEEALKDENNVFTLLRLIQDLDELVKQ